MRHFFRTVILVVILATIATLAFNITHYLISRQSQIAELRREKAELQDIISRLTGRTRRAELLVDGQVINGDGKIIQTTLLWREFTIGTNGQQIPLPMRKIVIPGDMPHVDGFVLKFQDKYVESGDLLRGKSLAFFRSIYGDTQAPADGVSLLGPNGVPLVLSDTHGHPNALERQLWSKITELMKHPNQCTRFGLTLVQGEAVYRPVVPGKLYVIYLRNDGGLEFTRQVGESSLVHELLKQANTDRSHLAPAQ